MKKEYNAPDDVPLYAFTRDLSGGMNTRQHEQVITETQAVRLENILLDVQGSRQIRPGSIRIDSSFPSSESAGYGLFGFDPDGGEFEILSVQNGDLSGWPGSGAFAIYSSAFTDGYITTMIKAGQLTQNDVVIISNGIDNAYVMYQDHTVIDLMEGDYSCPKTPAIAFYGNRLWALKDNLAYFSAAYPTYYYPTHAEIIGDQSLFGGMSGDKIKVTIDSVVYDDIDISAATDIDDVVTAINTRTGGTEASKTTEGYLKITSTTYGLVSNCAIADGTSTVQPVVADLFENSDKSNTGYAPFGRNTDAFRVQVGAERAIVATREQGLIFLGADQIWQLMPSVNPDPTTDKPQKVLEIGCEAGRTAVQVADDIYFLANDGVRGLFRTELDKLQTGQSFPLSYLLKDEFDDINWAHINKACAVYYDNKYIISLPTGVADYNNICWVYYPALKAWVIYTGWNISAFAKLNISGKQVLFGIDSVTGKVRKLFYGNDDDGEAIVFSEISRADDFKAPLQFKYGGELKVRVSGGNGTLIVSANADGEGWVQLGTIDLAIVGVTFPVIFPVSFNNTEEALGIWHLDDAGFTKFKRIKRKIYCADLNASIVILESLTTAFQDAYLTEE